MGINGNPRATRKEVRIREPYTFVNIGTTELVKKRWDIPSGTGYLAAPRD